MWFKNIQVFQLKNAEWMDWKFLLGSLPEYHLKECGARDEFTFGTLPLIRNSGLFFTDSPSHMVLFRFGKEEKVLPSSVVSEELNAKIDEIEITEGRKVGRKEKADLKEEIVHTLRQRAFSKRSDVWLYIDIKESLLVLNSTNAGMTEQSFKLLQTMLGSFPMIPIRATLSPSKVMTDWLTTNSLPASLETGSTCNVKDSSEDKAEIRFKALEPLSDDVTRHLEQGMSVSSLALRYSDKINFTLNDDLTLSKVKWDDTLIEVAFNDVGDDDNVKTMLDSNFTIMSGAFREFWQSFTQWFEVNTDD